MVTEKEYEDCADALVEPFRIKAVESIKLPNRALRAQILEKAFYSVAYLNSADVYIDLCTDSGTGAMSNEQWAALMRGDEAYMRSKSFLCFEEAVQKITSFVHVIPTHQGRAAENLLMRVLVKPGDIVISNTFFDTTRAHVENRDAIALDVIGDELWNFQSNVDFKGNFDVAKLHVALERYHSKVPFILITIVNNMACSSPVSMANIAAVHELARRYNKPIFFDACRFAENAYFIQQREASHKDKSILDIVQEMFTYGDGCYMSAKKDGLVNVGGFIALNDGELALRLKEQLVLYEGFMSYGGLARRDLEAIAIGLFEGIDQAYLKHRTAQVAYLGELFEREAQVTISKPTGGSGVFVDVKSIYPHLAAEQLPTIALTCDLYLEGGVRAGAFPFHINVIDSLTGEISTKNFEFARFAIPRRLYTKSHLEYVAKVMKRVKEKAPQNKGYRFTYAPKTLTHFFAQCAPL